MVSALSPPSDPFPGAADVRGTDHVDLSPGRRTNSTLADRFNVFAALECAPAGSGMSVDSPTYAALSRHIAKTEALLSLARECRPGQPIPNLLFAAAKRLVADEPDTPVAGLYRRAAQGGKPLPELGQEFERFCQARADKIVALVRTRNVQTNEVGRCSNLMPAFGCVANDAGRDLALIDVGAGACLNLLWDRFDYRYSDGSSFGSGRSPVKITCEVRGRWPRLPAQFPNVSFRAGIDLHPINLADREQYRWLRP